ncbi:hypothetical protein [Marivivens sp. JLT3646]|uniref:hypothetical protein n=1 Tax=Marivivens sp. JLT3646 TaxID=1920883 RepID=UPI0007FD6A02|nr:hypothetical protein [Marivivens sp. JLT3646]APO85825.1 hypothetical protein BSK21_01470 [Marivivens sp. JLT3646]OBR37084.1 hypothetical protein A9199_07075 [Donghicola sp. JL3646]
MEPNYDYIKVKTKLPTQKQNKKNLEERILSALHHVAKGLAEDDRLLPIFIRLENDLMQVQNELAALERSKSYLKHLN